VTGALLRLGGPLLRHARRVRALAWSPDGRLLASGGADGTVRVHDLAAGLVQSRIDAGGEVLAIAWREDGRTLWIGGAAGLLLADAATGAVLERAEDVRVPVRAIALTPGGRRMATAEAGREAAIRETAKGRVLRRIEGPCEAPVMALAPDGKTIAQGGDADAILVHEVTTGKLEARVGTGSGSEVSALAFAYEGRLLLAGERSGRLRRFDVAPRLELPVMEVLGAGRAVATIAVTPDGERLATGGEDATIALVDAATGVVSARVEAHLAGVLGMAFSPDGLRLASAGESCLVRLFDAASLAPLTTPSGGHEERVAGVAFVMGGADVQGGAGVASGPRVVTAGEEGALRISCATSGAVLATLRTGGPAIVSLAAGRTSPLVVLGASDGTVRVVDAALLVEVRVVTGHQGWARAVAISDDGGLAASGGADRTVRLFDPASGETRAVVSLPESAGEVLSLAFMDGGRTLAVTAAYGRRFSPLVGATTTEGGRSVYLVDTALGAVAREAPLPESTFESRLVCAAGPEGTLAVALRGPRVALVDARPGAGPGRLLPLRVRFEAIVASPDGTMIYGADRLDPRDQGGGTIAVIEAATGRLVRTLAGPEAQATALALDAGGKRLLAGYADGTAAVWDVGA